MAIGTINKEELEKLIFEASSKGYRPLGVSEKLGMYKNFDEGYRMQFFFDELLPKKGESRYTVAVMFTLEDECCSAMFEDVTNTSIAHWEYVADMTIETWRKVFD